MMLVSLSALQATGFVSHMLPANGRRRPSAAVARTSAAQSRNCCVLISAAKGRAWGRGEEITDQRNSKLVEESEELHRQLFGDLNPYLEAKAAAKYIPGIHHVGTWEAAVTPPSGKLPAGFAAAFEHSKVHEATQAVQQAAEAAMEAAGGTSGFFLTLTERASGHTMPLLVKCALGGTQVDKIFWPNDIGSMLLPPALLRQQGATSSASRPPGGGLFGSTYMPSLSRSCATRAACPSFCPLRMPGEVWQSI